MNKKSLALIALLFLSLGFASMGVASRWMDEGLGNFTQVFLRVTGALVITLPLFWKNISWKKIFSLKASDWLILVAIGTIGYAVMIYSITKAALLANLVNVTVLYSTVPFWVYIYGLLLARQKFSWKTAGLLVLSFWGIGLVSSGQILPRFGQFGVGEWLALAAAAFDAVWYMGIKLLENKLNSQEITIMALSIASISTLGMVIILNEPFSPLAFSNWHVTSALIFGILQNGWVTPLMAFALKHIDEVVATQLMLAESIFALMYGYFIFGETLGLAQIGGSLVIISSVFLMNKLQAAST